MIVNNSPSSCWSCRGPLFILTPFCPTCRVIQPPDLGVDFFALFSVVPGFVVDLERLEVVYQDLQQQFHPDRFAAKSTTERRYSLEHVTRLNEGYRTLRDPLSLAVYILRQGGYTTAEGENSQPADPAFLMEVMELREGLEELDIGREGASAALDAMRDDVERRCKEEIAALAVLFADYFADSEQKHLVAAAVIVDKLRYHNKFLEELDQREESLF